MHIKTCGSSIFCNEVKSLYKLLIVELNNIHRFNISNYILWIFAQKTSVFDCHTLPCLCPPDTNVVIKLIVIIIIVKSTSTCTNCGKTNHIFVLIIVEKKKNISNTNCHI
jgi:hypothetical protein